MPSSPALNELSLKPGYEIIDSLNNNGRVPADINIANMTAYRETNSSQTIDGIVVQNAYTFDFDDGAVPGWSSSNLYLLDYTNNFHPFIQMYQHSQNLIPHTQITINKCLTDNLPSPYAVVNQTTGGLTNLQKIVNFINGFPPVLSCPEPTQSNLNIASFGSIIPGASITENL